MGLHRLRENSCRREAGGFNPRISRAKLSPALAAEGRFHLISPQASIFSAACSAHEKAAPLERLQARALEILPAFARTPT